jgi:hypothetical protein
MVAASIVAATALVYIPGPAAAQVIVDIEPGEDIQAVVDAHAPGTTFRLRSGVHRMQTIAPRDRDTFIGESGAVLSGARLLTDFVPSGRFWVAYGQTQEGERTTHFRCHWAFPRCGIPEELYINDERLEPVASLEEVGPPKWGDSPGQWFFDYDNDAIYISYDPTWLKVETSVSSAAIMSKAENVTIVGLVIEKYATMAQIGAIHGQEGKNWRIIGNEIRKNHGSGVRVGTGSEVIWNYIHNNGQLGLFGFGDNILVEGNEIFANNYAHYLDRWEGGGAKFFAGANIVVRNNYSHHNDGPGLWSDYDCIDTLYESNRVEDNTEMGIFHEISYRAVIRYNVVKRNGFGYPDWIAGAGILVAGSPDVEVYGNLVEENADGIGGMQQNRGSGAYGPYELRNLWVHDNVIINNSGWTGVAQDINDKSFFTNKNNRFTNNTYQLGSSQYPFQWMDGERTLAEWLNYGHDSTSTFIK